LGYLLYGKRQGLVVDGGAVEEILEFLRLKGLVLKLITNTHGHGDHTCGNQRLMAESKAQLFENVSVRGEKRIELDGEFIEILETPGHTADSICFRTADILVTGDTLFNGTVGNCFSGDMQSFFASIRKLMQLPPETRVYAGHDYVRDSLAFAAKVEPNNRKIEAYLEKYDPAHVVSCLTDELGVNPFLRFNQQSIMEELSRRGMKRSTEFERWESLMLIE